MIQRLVLAAFAAVVVLGPVDLRAQERSDSLLVSPSRGSEVAGATIGAALGSAGGFSIGAIAAFSMSYNNDGNDGLAFTTLFLSTTLGAAAGAALVNDDFASSFLGSMVGVGAGAAAAWLIAESFDGAGTWVTFTLVHGLVTALVADSGS